jgi:hypothetical protein
MSSPRTGFCVECDGYSDDLMKYGKVMLCRACLGGSDENVFETIEGEDFVEYPSTDNPHDWLPDDGDPEA